MPGFLPLATAYHNISFTNKEQRIILNFIQFLHSRSLLDVHHLQINSVTTDHQISILSPPRIFTNFQATGGRNGSIGNHLLQIPKSKSKLWTVSRPVCLGAWNPRRNFFFSFLILRQLRICLCGALSDEKFRL